MISRFTVAAAGVLLAGNAALAAGPGKARLVIDVKVGGSENWTSPQGGDHATVRIAQTYSLTTVVQTDGELITFNQKAPDYAEKQMRKAAHVAQAVQAAKGQSNVKPMTQQEMQVRMAQGQKACNGDQKCLYKLAMEAQQWTTQMLAASAPPAPVEEETEADEIYLQYLGFEGCGAKFHITVNDFTEGTYADVQGHLPFSNKRTADYSGDDVQRTLLCVSHNIVMDTKEKVIWTDGFLLPGARGKTVSTSDGRTSESEGEMPLQADALEWVSDPLRKAPLSGTRKTTLPTSGSKGNSGVPYAAAKKGSVQVELTWKFETI